MVERIHDSVFLTTGFNAIRDFYDFCLGGTIVMVFTGAGQFGIDVINRWGRVVDPPLFIPSMKYEIEKTIVPAFAYEGFPVTGEILTFHHWTVITFLRAWEPSKEGSKPSRKAWAPSGRAWEPSRRVPEPWRAPLKGAASLNF
jgi:hypothetical protein